MPILPNSFKNRIRENIPTFILWGQHYLDTKARWGHEKKQKTKGQSISLIIEMQKSPKVLANRNQKDNKRTIHQDQLGFVPEISGWFNTCKSVYVIITLTENKIKSNDHLNKCGRKHLTKTASIHHKNPQQIGNIYPFNIKFLLKSESHECIKSPF